MSRRAWMVRSEGDDFLIDEFMDHNVVAIGWNDLGLIPLTINDIK